MTIFYHAGSLFELLRGADAGIRKAFPTFCARQRIYLAFPKGLIAYPAFAKGLIAKTVCPLVHMLNFLSDISRLFHYWACVPLSSCTSFREGRASSSSVGSTAKSVCFCCVSWLTAEKYSSMTLDATWHSCRYCFICHRDSSSLLSLQLRSGVNSSFDYNSVIQKK